jgi:hypothetical protein
MDLRHGQKADSQLINALIARVKWHFVSPVTRVSGHLEGCGSALFRV